MGEKTNQRVMLTKQLLKNALIKMLQTQSLHQISIRDLCEQSGIHRSTFYKYYGSQYDLLTEMEQDTINKIEKHLAQPGANDLHTISELLRYVENNIDFLKLLFNSNADPEFPQKLFSVPQIQDTIKTKLGVDMTTEEYEYVYTFQINGVYHMVLQWINKENRESTDWMAKLLIRQFSWV